MNLICCITVHYIIMYSKPTNALSQNIFYEVLQVTSIFRSYSRQSSPCFKELIKCTIIVNLHRIFAHILYKEIKFKLLLN